MNNQQRKDVRLKWLWQKNNAKRRGIEFDFPFEQWFQYWLDSGHWDERGIARSDQYVMSRIGDTGPYRIDNVVIKQNKDNVLEGNVGISKPQTLLSCLNCKHIIPSNNRFRHWNGKRCHQKKAPRRVLSCEPINLED